MARRVLRFSLVFIAIGLICSVTSQTGHAQSALERLERQLDRVLGPGGETNNAQNSTQNRGPGADDVPTSPPGQDPDTLPAPLPRGALDRLERSIESGALRPYLGITVSDLNSVNEQGLEVPVRSGAVIETVVDGSPADEAEIEAGAVVVAIDGRRVDRGADLVTHLQRRRPGDEVVLLYYRGARLQRTRITLAAIAGEQLNAIPGGAIPGGAIPEVAVSGETLPRDAAPLPPETVEGSGDLPVPPPTAPDTTQDRSGQRGGRLELFDRENGRLLPRLGNRNQDELIEIIQQQQRTIEALERRVTELERRVGVSGSD